jgi:hypothetical protein
VFYSRLPDCDPLRSVITMTGAERTAELGSLFESVTGETSVVDRQLNEAGTRVVDEHVDGGAVGAVEHHGFADAIDGPSPSDGRV